MKNYRFFLERSSQNPKLKKEKEIELCHLLLRCKSVKHKSEIFYKRKKNAVKSVIRTGKRPKIFCREIHS